MSNGRWYPLDFARSRRTTPARHTVGQRGRPYYPCFFAQAQTVAGIDIAGMMVDHLLGKLAAAPTT